MAKYPDTTVTMERDSSVGDKLLEVQFLKPKSRSSSVRKIDPQFAKKTFRVTFGALTALNEANDRINSSLESLFRGIGKEPAEKKRVSPMDAGMAIFLYTRKIEPKSLPDGEIVLDEATVRELLKKQFKGHF